MNLEIMKVGIFKGSSYVITHTDDGRYNWYCGYVEVPKNHIYYGQYYDDINDIGFDTNHVYSDRCNNLAFVENECMNIIEQLIKLNN